MLYDGKKVLAATALIVIAVTSIARAQSAINTSTVVVTESKVWMVYLPDIVVEPNIVRTVSLSNALNLSLYFTHTIIRLSLIDLGGLYEDMEQFMVTFKDESYVYAILTQDQPVAEFVYQTSVKIEKQRIDVEVIISYKANSALPETIKYMVYGQVVSTLGTRLE